MLKRGNLFNLLCMYMYVKVNLVEMVGPAEMNDKSISKKMGKYSFLQFLNCAITDKMPQLALLKGIYKMYLCMDFIQ